MKKTILIALCLFSGFIANAQHVIRIAPENGDMTKKIQAAIEQARSYNGKAVVIKLQNADYNLHRESSSQILYHISNTASEKENPDQTKHIGLWLKDLKNVTIDGQGARFVTHGEMTSFVIDQCENITFNSACATPAVVFPTLLKLAQKHLQKLSTGSSIYFNQQITNLMSRMNAPFPARMTLPEQGAFEIGYYHQTQKRYEKKQ